MSDLQKLGTLIAAIVGLLTLATSVWTASSNFTQINSKLDVLVQSSNETRIILDRHEQEIGALSRLAENLEQGALIYVYKDHSYLVVKTPKGDELEVPIHVRTE